jgi:hypothetical protein
MENPIKHWMKRHHEKDGTNIELEDVQPEHPDAYPARNLKDRLDRRRDEIDEIEGGHKGLPEGPGGY